MGFLTDNSLYLKYVIPEMRCDKCGKPINLGWYSYKLGYEWLCQQCFYDLVEEKDKNGTPV